jgi:FkbM family methyltransferase
MMSDGYSDFTSIRQINIDGETDWYWVKSDTGCFGDKTDKPMRDWLESHKDKFFKYLKKNDAVVAGGTSCGMYARFYAKHFKYVYAFEPDPLNFHCMVNNTQYDNVIKMNCAIGYGNGIVGLVRTDKTNVGMNHITDKNKFHIVMMAIDSLNLDACDLIQLDVEGFEEHAVFGAQNTIAQYKPVIIGERFGTPENQKYMRSLGYELKDQSFLDYIYTPVE